jgi:hypothetical protein
VLVLKMLVYNITIFLSNKGPLTTELLDLVLATNMVEALVSGQRYLAYEL